MTRYAKSSLLIASAVILSACSPFESFEESSTRVKNFEEAGSVQIAVLSSTPWSVAKNELQPHFIIDEESALNAAAPMTAQFTSQLLASRHAGLSASAAAKGVTTGTTSAAPAKNTVPAADSSKNVPDFGIDPMLKYQAATALFQEVKMLNNYVKDAVGADGAYARVVRLQISLQPRQRNLPYDAYTQISAFPNNIEKLSHPVAAAKAAGAEPKMCANGASGNVEILPLLVTDDIESILASRSRHLSEQADLALLASVSGLGLSGDLSRAVDQIQQISRRDINSIMTIARLSHNTVTVRLGAQQESGSQYAMVPRTHNITLLVIYKPCNKAMTSATLSFMAHTDLVDAMTGDSLPVQDEFKRLKSVRRGIEAKFPLEFSQEQFSVLWSFTEANDWDGFFKSFTESLNSVSKNTGRKGDIDEMKKHSGEVAAALWADLTSLRLGNPYSLAILPIDLTKDLAKN